MLEPKNKRNIFILADRLNRHIPILKKSCKKIWFFLISSLYISFCLISLVALSIVMEQYDIIAHSSLPFICLILNILLFIYLYSLKKKALKEYQYCRNSSNLISDMVDWRVYRKRQLYKPLDSKIQEPLNDFFKFCNSHYCIFEKGKLIYSILYYMNCFNIVLIILYLANILTNSLTRLS